MKRKILIIISIIFMIIGISLFCFPHVSNFVYEQGVERDKEEFVEKVTRSENEEVLDRLYKDLQEKNKILYKDMQNNLIDPFLYEHQAIDLSEYGIYNNVIGYINIPKMNIELPILLGANSSNMLKGAVHLTETSYPIGGINTNSVIAAHRGYGKASLFRNIEKLEVGDEIFIKNFKEELTYVVYDIKIIEPDDFEELKIQDGEDIITLITCHPYRINSHRYIVKAKRKK